jgi:DNA-binding transcriptional LysR family regulator
MDMRKISYFLAVCEELNFTRAAKRCKVAQPSLSAAIQRLEKEFGGRLFVRGVTGVQLTRLGHAVRPHFEKINQKVEFVRKTFPTTRLSVQMSSDGTRKLKSATCRSHGRVRLS